MMAGAQKTITNDLYWDGSAHIGNYVVFFDEKDGEKQLFLGMVDWESTVHYSNVDLLSERLRFWRRTGLRGLEKLSLDEASQRLEEHVIKPGIMRSLDRDGYTLVEGIRSEEPSTAPKYFRSKFRKGFARGEKFPDERRPVTLDLLMDAFEFEVPILAM